MNYARLLLISVILFVFLCTATVVIVSQSSTRQVGTPNCEIYTEGSGVRCARIRCDTSDSSGIPAQGTTPNCSPTHPSEQYQLHCESRGGANCEVTSQVTCNADSRGASFGRTCTEEDDIIRIRTIQSPQITCPVTCPGCPTAGPNKPCRRATWDTTYCRWNDAPCYTAECRSAETDTSAKIFKGDTAQRCTACNPEPWELQDCSALGGNYDWTYCQCGFSPIVIDVAGNGFNLTSSSNGARFDINADSRQEQISWTSANSDDAWLALDRNGNGQIDDGEELFGNFTEQPAPTQKQEKNGFLALAEFDELANGGNGDGRITAQDTIFQSLRLWQDTNHNGISEVAELKTLSQLGLAMIELDYKESKRTDEHGNRFKYRAKVKDANGTQINRWAWDVYLIVEKNP